MFGNVGGVLAELSVEGANGRVGHRAGVRDYVQHRGQVNVDTGGVKLEPPGLSLCAKGVHRGGALLQG